MPSLKSNSLNNFDSQYELVLPYDYHKIKKSFSTSEINPLFYDDFNRSYNVSQYFNLKNGKKEKSEENRKNEFKYTLKISGITDNNNKKLFHKKDLLNKGFKKRIKRINIRKFGSKF